MESLLVIGQRENIQNSERPYTSPIIMAVDYRIKGVQKIYNIIGTINHHIIQIRTCLLENHSDTLQYQLPVHLERLQEISGRMEALKVESNIQNVRKEFKVIYKKLKKINNDLSTIVDNVF